MTVETRNASLNTFAVTIQALCVNGKQMTLAVFRQLPADIPENKESELWGVVRYSIRDDGDLWLVFSHDGFLFRRALQPAPEGFVLRGERSAKEELERWQEMRTMRDDLYKEKIDEAREGMLFCEAMADEERWRASCDKKLIDRLPQLFIAV